MIAEAKVPPSGRDFEIYRLAKIEMHTTRLIAKALSLSQTRICQVIARVTEFLLEAVAANDEHRERQLALARQLAAERFDVLIGEAMTSFRDSKGPQTIIREVELPGRMPTRTSTMRKSCGEARYLTVGARLTQLAGTLMASELSGLIAAALPEHLSQEPSSQEPSPPNEDCSAAPPAEELKRAAKRKADDATDDGETTLHEKLIAQSRPKRAIFATVQRDDFQSDDVHLPQATNLEPAETSLDQIVPPLNRQQRRARQALLAKRKAAQRRQRAS